MLPHSFFFLIAASVADIAAVNANGIANGMVMLMLLV